MVLAELAVTILALVSTGYWASPLAFSMVTAVAVGFGFFTDPLLDEVTSLDEISAALVLSPLLVSMMGGVGAPFAWMPALWPLGCCFWPIYFVLAYQWIVNAVRWSWLGAGVLTSIVYFGILTKFFGAMSV